MTTAYSEQLKHFAARRAHVVRLYKQKSPRLSLREIGLKMDPPISSQRVGKIIAQEGATR